MANDSARYGMDIVCLQELKLTREQLPSAKIQAKGRTWNAVASQAKITQIYPKRATTGGCMVAASGGAGVRTHESAVNDEIAHRLAACHVGAEVALGRSEGWP